ncbi:MAG: insulinase family protein [Deltaproteobacteria bacterium]|nr:insulinase family protein [Deltaproteobacteria bacterium]
MKYTLPNGLKIVLVESHASPVVTFQAWVGVGSADEPAEVAGIAHVFEHMLFKGTTRRGVGQIAREIESAGGEINAWTAFDETVFHVVLASRFFDTGLDIIADGLQSSSLDEAELRRELKVVLEEIKQGEDNPSRVATQALFGAAFTRHPYRRPVIGSARTVQKLTRDIVVDFYQRWYVANNVTLVVVGDFDSTRARERIEAAFGGFRQRPLERPERTEPEQRAARAAVLPRDVREAHLAMAFHIPGIRHEDTGALDVLGIILGQGDSSRLNLEVRRNRQLVTDVYAYAYTPRDHGVLAVGASMPPTQVEAASRAVLDEVYRLAYDEVSAEEINKARTIIESENVYQKETVQGLARKVGFFETVAGDLAYEDEYHRQVQAVTPAKVREVAQRYLRADRLTAVAVIPEPSKGKEAGKAAEQMRERLLALGAASAADAERRHAASAAGAAAADEVDLDVLPSGARLIIKRDASVPVVAFRAVWLGGLRYEDARSNGISNMLAALLTRGTNTRTGEEISREVEGMAGSMGGFSGRNSFGIRAEMLSRHWERGLEILADCVQNPAFSEEEVEKQRRQVLAEIQAQEDNLSQVVFRLFNEAFYKKHPYRLDMLGTPQSVSALSRRRLVEFYRRHVSTDRMTLAIVGDVDPQRVKAKVRALFDGQPRSVQPPPEVAAEPPRTAGGPEQVFKFLNRQQAHLVVGFPGTSVKHPDRFALEVLATVLSGQGGRLFTELRDKRALAYRLNAFSLEGLDPGYFAVYLATSPQNLEAAVSGIRAEIQKLAEHPVPEGELDRARRYLVGTHEISLQRRSAVSSSLAFHECYGLGWAEYRRYAPGVLAVGAADVQRVAREYLDWKRAVITVVKPEESTPGVLKKRGIAGRARTGGAGVRHAAGVVPAVPPGIRPARDADPLRPGIE